MRPDDLDPVAIDRWLVPGLAVVKLGCLGAFDPFAGDGEPQKIRSVWAVHVLRKRMFFGIPLHGETVIQVHDYSGPVTTMTLLHALHDRGMLRPEAYESPS